MTAGARQRAAICEIGWAGLTASVEAFRDEAGRITALGEVRFPGGRAGKTRHLGELADAIAAVDRYLATPVKVGASGRLLVTLADLAIVLRPNGPSAFLEVVKTLARLEAGDPADAAERRSAGLSQKEVCDG